MAKTVEEIMNPELFRVRPDDTAAHALDYIMALGIHGAPVIDPYDKPVGWVSVQDLVPPEHARVSERMARPVVAVKPKATLEDAAREMGEMDLHRAAVVDKDGNIIGVVSSLDLMRGLVGMPARHPRSFPHKDRYTGLTWSDDELFGEEQVAKVPAEAGVLALVHGGKNRTERVVWAEAAANLASHLKEILAHPDKHIPQGAQAMAKGEVRFRYAVAPDTAQRMRALRGVLLDARDKARPA